jgi:hypothetical protein
LRPLAAPPPTKLAPRLLGAGYQDTQQILAWGVVPLSIFRTEPPVLISCSYTNHAFLFLERAFGLGLGFPFEAEGLNGT